MLQLIAACTVAGTFIASGVSTAVGIFGKDTFAPCDPNALGLPGQSWTNSSSADQLLDTVGGFSLVGGLLSNETIVCPLYKANMWVAFIIA